MNIKYSSISKKILRVEIDGTYFGILLERKPNSFDVLVGAEVTAEKLDGLTSVEKWIEENYPSL